MKTLSIELRPSCLEEVIGHEDVKRVLRAKIAKDEIPVAFLLSGPPGVGKTTLAEIIAKMVDGEVTTIQAADKNGVDDMRELVSRSESLPMNSRFKVYILDEAHRLTPPAQDVLLVPTEDKNSRTIWVFNTTEPAKLSAALRSRCLHFDLKPLRPIDITGLVHRALIASNCPMPTSLAAVAEEITAYLVKARVTSPRGILMVVEKHLAGTPLEQCVLGAEHAPEYREVANAILTGNWNKTRDLLQKIPTADSKAMRAVVAAFLGSALLRADAGPNADALATCLVGMSSYAGFEDGLSYAAFKAVAYKCCKAIGR